MTALSEARDTIRRDGELIQFPVKAGATIYQGALLEFNGGAVQPAAKGANKVIAGVAEEGGAVVAGGSDGDAKVLVRRPGMFKFANAAATGAIAAGDVGKNAYITDDQTVTKTATGSSIAGRIIAVDADGGIWVEIK